MVKNPNLYDRQNLFGLIQNFMYRDTFDLKVLPEMKAAGLQREPGWADTLRMQTH